MALTLSFTVKLTKSICEFSIFNRFVILFNSLFRQQSLRVVKLNAA